MVANTITQHQNRTGVAQGNGAATPARSPSPESAGELKKALEVLFHHCHGKRGVRLIAYAVPRCIWVPVPYAPGWEKILTHEYIYYMDITLGGGKLTVEVNKLINVPGCQPPFETFSVVMETWGELFEFLREFVEKNYVTIIEVEKTIKETIWTSR